MAKDDVAQALTLWRESLVNLTGVNRLIKFKASKTGTVFLAAPAPQAILNGLRGTALWRFQGATDVAGDEGETLPVRALQGVRATDSGYMLRSPHLDKDLGPILRGLMRRANAEFLDRGLHVLYASFGMLHWVDEDDTQMQSPLLLVPVSLESEGPKSTPRLKGAEDDTVFNPALTLRLRDFGVHLPPIEELDDSNLDSVFGAVRSAIRRQPGWEVEPTVLISCFSFHKEAMYRDLLDNEEIVLGHPLDD